MSETICIVGLGYVGLPLAVAFAKHYPVIGFDIDKDKVAALQQGIDETRAVEPIELQTAKIFFTSDPREIQKAQWVIIAVPTPVDEAKHPDLSQVKQASAIVGKQLHEGMTVIYESTVYPGVTEEICLPILEKESGLCLGQFGLGYSPERINPGDKTHQLHNTIKIVSGHDEATRKKIAALYGKIVVADIYEAASIKVAEAAKIVENVQRDLNIALMNELSLIFHKLHIDTKEVLDAAGTKWNFHKYYPGLVGGHCIGVDPYYLAFQATEHGYHPKIILSGREVNDYMARHVAELAIKELNNQGKVLKHCTIVLLGLTFKEDVTDIRNSRAYHVMKHLQEYGITVIGCEPNITPEKVQQAFGIHSCSVSQLPQCDACIIINKHQQFRTLTLNDLKQRMATPILIDTKRLFSKTEALAHGIIFRSL